MIEVCGAAELCIVFLPRPPLKVASVVWPMCEGVGGALLAAGCSVCRLHSPKWHNSLDKSGRC